MNTRKIRTSRRALLVGVAVLALGVNTGCERDPSGRGPIAGLWSTPEPLPPFSCPTPNACRGLYVVYAAPHGDGAQLFRVPLAGGTAVPVSPAFERFERWEPVGTDGRIVIAADGHLSIASLTGRDEARRLHDGALEATPIFRVTDDGRRVIGRMKEPDGDALWSLPLEAGEPARIGPAPDGRRMSWHGEAPVEGRLAFLRLSDGAPAEAWVSTVDGGTPAVLVTDKVPRGIYASQLAVAAGGEVIFVAQTAMGTMAFATRLNGEPARPIGPALSPGDAVRGLEPTPDGAAVVLRVDHADVPSFTLWNVPLDGSEPIRLTPPDTRGHAMDESFWIAPHGRVLYRTTDDTEDWGGDYGVLWSVPIEGGAPPVQLSLDASWTSAYSIVYVRPDSDRVLYLSSRPWTGFSLWSVPTDGSSPPVALVDRGLGTGVAAGLVRWESPGWVSAGTLGRAWRVYTAPVDGSAPTRVLAPSATGAVFGPSTLPGQTDFAVLTAALRDPDVREIYVTTLDGRLPPRPLFAAPTPVAGWGHAELVRVDDQP